MTNETPFLGPGHVDLNLGLQSLKHILPERAYVLAYAPDYDHFARMQYVDGLIQSASPLAFDSHQKAVFVGHQLEADQVRDHLREAGVENVAVFIGSLNYSLGQSEMIRDAGGWHSMCIYFDGNQQVARRAMQPRHRSQFTKRQPSGKDRKKARRLAKAGRQASR